MKISIPQQLVISITVKCARHSLAIDPPGEVKL